MTKKLTAIEGNTQMLDGGAMFGNAPKALWSKWLPPDELNRVPLSCRALLIEEDDKNILLETGVGAFFDPKLRARYGVKEERHVLLDSLAELGLGHEDINIIILSHLHFDHAGGLLSAWQEGREATLLFPNAQFVISKAAWQRASAPHLRDRASYIPALNQLLESSGRLHLMDSETSALLGDDYRFHFSNGHTPGLMMTEIALPTAPVIFVADLAPGTAWLNQSITMGYDRCAETLIDEKLVLLQDWMSRRVRLFYTHDQAVCLSAISQDERGRFCAAEPLKVMHRWMA